MAIQFRCEKCGHCGAAPDKQAGRIVKCPKCGQSFQISPSMLPALDKSSNLPALPNTPIYDISPQGEDRRFEYKMVQIPPTIVVREAKGQEAAVYLDEVVNSQARQGWDFYRVDQIGVQVASGCLTALLGAKAETVFHYVITFRRKVKD